MSHDLIDKKRKKLNEEIGIAKHYLSGNLEKVNVSDYIVYPEGFVSNIVESIGSLPFNMARTTKSKSKKIDVDKNKFRDMVDIFKIITEP